MSEKKEELGLMDRFGLLDNNEDRFYFIAFHLQRIEDMLAKHDMKIK